MLKTISPSIPKGEFGGLGGQKCKSLENLPNGWTDWHHIWYTSVDSSGNGQLAPRYTRGGHWGGGLRVKNSKVWKIYQTVGPIGTTFGIMGMVIG